MGAKNMELKDMEKNSEVVAGILKSMSHPQRLLILCHLCEGELTVSELLPLTNMSQSHLSQTLHRMKLENLISSKKDGRLQFYALKDKRIKNFINFLHKTFCTN